jgi:hypothetical protein
MYRVNVELSHSYNSTLGGVMRDLNISEIEAVAGGPGAGLCALAGHPFAIGACIALYEAIRAAVEAANRAYQECLSNNGGSHEYCSGPEPLLGY